MSDTFTHRTRSLVNNGRTAQSDRARSRVGPRCRHERGSSPSGSAGTEREWRPARGFHVVPRAPCRTTTITKYSYMPQSMSVSSLHRIR